MASPITERAIERNRPVPKNENDPATGTVLWHLNTAGLLAAAIERQMKNDGVAELHVDTNGPPSGGVVITRRTAWETFANALRAGRR
jgi:hypothetical protein